MAMLSVGLNDQVPIYKFCLQPFIEKKKKNAYMCCDCLLSHLGLGNWI